MVNNNPVTQGPVDEGKVADFARYEKKPPIEWTKPDLLSTIDDKNSPSYGKAFKDIVLISIVYFGSGALIFALATLVSGMIAWFLLGWALFFPVYLTSIGMVGIQTFINRNKGKLIVPIVGLSLALVSVLLELLSVLITRSQDAHYNTPLGFTLATGILGVLGFIVAVIAFKTHKILSIITIILAPTFIWGYLLTSSMHTDKLNKQNAGYRSELEKQKAEASITPQQEFHDALSSVDYTIYLPEDNTSYKVAKIPVQTKDYGGGVTDILVTKSSFSTEEQSSTVDYLFMNKATSLANVTPSTSSCVYILGTNGGNNKNLQCTFLGNSRSGAPIAYYTSKSTNKSIKNTYTYFFSKGSTYFNIGDDKNLFGDPGVDIIRFVDSLKPTTVDYIEKTFPVPHY